MKRNNNTSSFWDKMNLESESLLVNSPIYKYKNSVVLGWIPRNPLKLLNIGVGNGLLQKLLYTNRPQADLYGIDISKLAIFNLKKDEVGIYKIANATKIPFKSNLFDCVLALDVFEHLTTYQFYKSIREVYRVLKPTGMMVVSVPLNENKFDFTKNRHILKFTEPSLHRMLSKYFKKQKVVTLVAFRKTFLVKSLLNKVLKIRKANLLLASYIKK